MSEVPESWTFVTTAKKKKKKGYLDWMLNVFSSCCPDYQRLFADDLLLTFLLTTNTHFSLRGGSRSHHFKITSIFHPAQHWDLTKPQGNFWKAVQRHVTVDGSVFRLCILRMGCWCCGVVPVTQRNFLSLIGLDKLVLKSPLYLLEKLWPCVTIATFT